MCPLPETEILATPLATDFPSEVLPLDHAGGLRSPHTVCPPYLQSVATLLPLAGKGGHVRTIPRPRWVLRFAEIPSFFGVEWCRVGWGKQYYLMIVLYCLENSFVSYCLDFWAPDSHVRQVSLIFIFTYSHIRIFRSMESQIYIISRKHNIIQWKQEVTTTEQCMAVHVPSERQPNLSRTWLRCP